MSNHRIVENDYFEPYTKRSPWGSIQHEIVFGNSGIRFVSTAGHGGFILSGKANKKIPEVFRIKGGCYEEDCDAKIVLAFLFDTIHTMVIEQSFNRWEALKHKETQNKALYYLQYKYHYSAKWAVYQNKIIPEDEFNYERTISDKYAHYVDYSDYLDCIEQTKRQLRKKKIKPQEGMKIRFKNALAFEINRKTIVVSDFKLINVSTGVRPKWRFVPLKEQEHYFIGKIPNWLNREFEILQ
jgi:hypothetical protein